MENGKAAKRRDHLNGLARLVSQCRLNEADALAAKRDREAAAWSDLKASLQALASRVAAFGLPVQQALPLD